MRWLQQMLSSLLFFTLGELSPWARFDRLRLTMWN